MMITIRVSADAELSEDEEDVNGNDEYDDSFIDDRMSSPSSNQAEVGRVDMMAIYRSVKCSLFTYFQFHQSATNHCLLDWFHFPTMYLFLKPTA